MDDVTRRNGAERFEDEDDDLEELTELEHIARTGPYWVSRLAGAVLAHLGEAEERARGFLEEREGGDDEEGGDDDGGAGDAGDVDE